MEEMEGGRRGGASGLPAAVFFEAVGCVLGVHRYRGLPPTRLTTDNPPILFQAVGAHGWAASFAGVLVDVSLCEGQRNKSTAHARLSYVFFLLRSLPFLSKKIVHTN
jgi:hypothetical protein